MAVHLQNISKSYGDLLLFSECSFVFPDSCVICLTGPNGSGKSTLFKLILGQAHPDHGTLISHASRPVCVEQSFSGSMSLFEYCSSPFEYLKNEAVSLQAMRSSFSSLDETRRHRFADRESLFLKQGGYDWEYRVHGVLFGLGFREKDFSKSMEVLSGGEKRRAMLAKTLLEEADLYLLDEPTNHLDFKGIQWLVDWIQNKKSSIIFISHDRFFIEQTASMIVELEDRQLYKYSSKFEVFLEQRRLRREQETAEFKAQQRFIREQEDFIRRNIAGQKTRQAQSRRKILEKTARKSRPAEDTSFSFSITKSVREYAKVLELKGIAMEYSGLSLFSGTSFVVERSERIAVVGDNGCGKSTLLRIITGMEQAAAGTVEFSDNTVWGYLPQEIDQHIEPGITPLDFLHAVRPMS
jgi:ATP-binding cassette, subfamily F, member 3